jgi:RNA methyltransferase, TrmH family
MNTGAASPRCAVPAARDDAAACVSAAITGPCSARGRAVNTAPRVVSSRDNPSLALVRRVLREPSGYRRKGTPLWLEGDHLVRACVERGVTLQQVLITTAAWEQPRLRELAQAAPRVLLLGDALFGELSGLESPAAIGALIECPASAPWQGDRPAVILDRLQDAGNVGSILRSAAAFGVTQVLALKGTAALWSPKVLRAAMGAHFALVLHEGLELPSLDALRVPWVATSSHAAQALHEAALPHPCAWVFGHEGQGSGAEISARCALTVRIAQPGGEESLNVAAAAAICLHEAMRRSYL